MVKKTKKPTNEDTSDYIRRLVEILQEINRLTVKAQLEINSFISMYGKYIERRNLRYPCSPEGRRLDDREDTIPSSSSGLQR